MTRLEWIEAADDDTLIPARVVKQALRDVATAAGPENLSTVQAARLLGFSPKWWSRRAPEIDGAWQEEGYWRIPASAARSYIAQRQHGQASPAHAASARSSRLPTRKLAVLEGGPQTVGRRPSRPTRSKGTRLA